MPDLPARPCGACKALVPTETGCKHWKPERNARTATSQREKRERKTVSRQKAAAERDQLVEEFKRSMKGGRP